MQTPFVKMAPAGRAESISVSGAAQNLTLLTFSTKRFAGSQRALCKSALAHGVSRVAPWSFDRLQDTKFYKDHRWVLDQPRGAGYWLWKPYLIGRELARVPDGGALIYYDVGPPGFGYLIRRSLGPLLRWCQEHNGGIFPGIYIPEWGPNRVWNKRDCFVAMQCDSAYYWDHPQYQATYSIWQKSKTAQEFVAEWLYWCSFPGLITDQENRMGKPNLEGFVEHRHDQAVLTNLALLKNLKSYGDPWTATPRCKDLNSIIARIEGNAPRFSPDALRWHARFIRWHLGQRARQYAQKAAKALLTRG